ncbi:MAG: UPF0182 family protein [Gemmatimonadota bacterium]|nr:UPF0182 family protein [Gemmatimonadota bacterium]
MEDETSRANIARLKPGQRGEGGGPRTAGKTADAGERRRRRLLAIILAASALVAIILPVAARRLTDLLWFEDIGYERVFLTKVAAQWILGVLAGVGGFLLLHINARVALRAVVIEPVPVMDQSRSGPKMRMAERARLAGLLALPACVLLAIVMALVAASEWKTLVQFYFRSPFGVTDPVFKRDISYYIFTVPAIATGLNFIDLALALGLAIIAIPIYMAGAAFSWRGWRTIVAPNAAKHLAILTAVLLAVGGARLLLLDLPGLLTAQHGSFAGANYTDLRVRIPLLRMVSGLAVLAAGATLVGARREGFVRNAATILGAFAIADVVLLSILPAAFQRLVVQPNELEREAPQIRHHIAATRRAWGIDSVDRRELGTKGPVTWQDVEANNATISNVRLWDREPLLQTFGQLQAIRTYYDFSAVDDDRYVIGGELRQVLLSARELNATALPTRTFINEHLTFTHGMGVTLGPSNQVTAEGLPLLWIKDLPPSSSISLRVTRPQIYFGEAANDFALAPTRQREFDYPAGAGDAAIYSSFQARTGVSVGSFLRRLLFAIRFRSLNVVLSGDLTSETRVLFHRNIAERAELALPFLRFDEDPYLVITNDGRLEWIMDAYTTTDRYPYSQRLIDGTNYMRNSVKVVIDAYDGRVTAYLADPGDPMIRTLSRIYPDLLHPLSEMPADLRAHLRYPADLFRAQTELYATFHMTDPETFYHKEDQWQIPAVDADAEREGFMRHIVMRLPGEHDPEFILMRPFTPRKKDNLAAWMVARNDGAHYGKLVAYRFPRQSLVFGPKQIVNRINQDTDVSRQVSLWDQRGSEVIRGELLVIPIEESLIYVQPLYLRAKGGKIPEMKRVIVAQESRVVMDETLEPALRKLFGISATAGVPRPGIDDTTANATAPGSAALLREAINHYDRARSAQRADDWATYGIEMRRLGESLRRLHEPSIPKR